MLILVTLAVATIALSALIVWFTNLEKLGRRHTIFLILIGVLLVEAILAGPAAQTPVGILRPRVGGQDFRPPDLVIIAALGARVVASPGLTRFRPELLLWMSFLTWYGFGVVVGLSNNFPAQDVLFQGKAVFYMVGGTIIASGADLRRTANGVRRLALPMAVLVAIATFFQIADISFTVSTPVQRLNRLGQLGNDSITLVIVLGAAVLLGEAVRRDRNLLATASGIVMLFAPLAGRQRASYAVLVAVVAGAMIIVLLTSFRRRLAASGTEAALVGAGIVAIAGLALVLTAGSSSGFVGAQVTDAFTGQRNENSAAARFDLADQAINLIQERPIAGWGLGVKVVRVAADSGRTTGAAAHNLSLDLTMRSGVIGASLFILSLAAILRLAAIRWRHDPLPGAAAIRVAGTLAILGFLAKGAVEPAMEKFRLSLMLGIGVGLILAELGTGADEEDDDDATSAETPARTTSGVRRATGVRREGSLT